MRVVVAAPPGILDSGKFIVPFPSRCDWVGAYKSDTAYYPYDLGYMTSMLKRAGFEAWLFDGHLRGTPAAEYQQQIMDKQPDVLIAECGHLSYPTMTRMMKEIGVKSILCGPFGTAFPDRAVADGWDVVIAGEYQTKVLAQLIGEDFFPGHIDPNYFPLPDDTAMTRGEYWEQHCVVKPMIQVYASRGCTVRCEFCTVPMYYGGYDTRGRHSTRHIDNICSEIEYLQARYPDNHGIMFNEENHAANIKWLRALAKRIIERGLNNMVYEAMCGYWTFTEADIELLARAGYRKLRLGVESLASETAGGKRGKHVNSDRLRLVLDWCKANNIRVHLYTIIGSPGSSEKGDLETLMHLLNLTGRGLVESIQHTICTPNPGTRLHQRCIENGWLLTDNTQDYNWYNAVINYPTYPAGRVAMVSAAYYQCLHGQWELRPNVESV